MRENRTVNIIDNYGRVELPEAYSNISRNIRRLRFLQVWKQIDWVVCSIWFWFLYTTLALIIFSLEKGFDAVCSPHGHDVFCLHLSISPITFSHCIGNCGCFLME